MPLILHIDTALDAASVCISDDETILGLKTNERQKDHATWLHGAIAELLREQTLALHQLDAVSVTIGPGSYTGLRIGLSAAKGLCYALNIPLIAVGTLETMARAVEKIDTAALICPLIDARRMEVFAAVYNNSLQEIVQPFALILDKNSFSDLLKDHRIIFCGSGSNKLQTILCHDNAIFMECRPTAAQLVAPAVTYWHEKRFANLAYIEPFYVKEFYSPQR
jgi:tRNA threonylcarbamoyladenosine biosynthesis protein TsaB